MKFDIVKIREEFPILRQKAHGKPLVYLDNAATSHKPRAVLKTLEQFYTEDNANIHRGVHILSERATEAYEAARAKVQHFIHANRPDEIIFTRGTTEAINLVAQSYGRPNLNAGDEVLITEMEHHSNIVPWQMICEERGALLKVVPVNDAGELRLDQFEKLLSSKTRIVAVTHMSNVLGTINPVKEIIQKAHQKNIPVLLDGAQAIAHLAVNVEELDCDFYVFSAHKLYGPTGVGVLYGKRALLEAMPPYQGGGDMIRSVTFEKTTYNQLPYKFEAGTPNIAGAIGLGAAIDYLRTIDFEKAAHHERELLAYATETLQSIPGVRIIGTAKNKASVISFSLEGVHPHDIGTILDQEGVAIRTGHHCAQPLMKRFGVPATARISLAFYNTREEIDIFIRSLKKVKEVFK
ncbi:MAG: cysteine desulfurase [Deltaproteobacteria bacterium]|nr:cysteine desulfurase [Deltaproteobacteria bacterium]